MESADIIFYVVFAFAIGAGVGFYVTRLIFQVM